MTVEFCRKGYMAPGPGAGTELKVPGVTPTTPSKLKYTIGRVAFALGARAAVSINAPTTALKSEHFGNFIMLSPPIIAMDLVLFYQSSMAWQDFIYFFVTPF